MNYQEACGYILNIPKFTSKNRPENIRELLAKLGGPQESCRVIHVAGTNGKGSVCAFLASVLLEDGKRVGLFTSPHLVDIRERFQIQGEMVPKEVFLRGFEAVKTAVDALLQESSGFCHPTFFEWLFAMAAVIFAREGVDYAILETGLGGRLDATNAVEHPLLTVITSISLDHTEILGDTVEQIAWEKAGILKDGVPLVYDGRDERVRKVIEAEAAKHGAPVRALLPGMYEIFMNTHKNIDFSLDTGYYLYNDIVVDSPAEYQAVNASLAVMAVEELDRIREGQAEHGAEAEGHAAGTEAQSAAVKGRAAEAGTRLAAADGKAVSGAQRISTETLLRGIRNTRWPGRMEEVLLDVFLDGGHNAAGIAEFAHTVEKFQDNRDITLLFSAVKEKDYEHMIKTLCDKIHFRTVVVTQVQSPRAVKAEELAALFESCLESSVVCCGDAREAFARALQYKGEGMLFCAGSLYLVGELKELLASGAVQV